MVVEWASSPACLVSKTWASTARQRRGAARCQGAKEVGERSSFSRRSEGRANGMGEATRALVREERARENRGQAGREVGRGAVEADVVREARVVMNWVVMEERVKGWRKGQLEEMEEERKVRREVERARQEVEEEEEEEE